MNKEQVLDKDFSDGFHEGYHAGWEDCKGWLVPFVRGVLERDDPEWSIEMLKGWLRTVEERMEVR